MNDKIKVPTCWDCEHSEPLIIGFDDSSRYKLFCKAKKAYRFSIHANFEFKAFGYAGCPKFKLIHKAVGPGLRIQSPEVIE